MPRIIAGTLHGRTLTSPPSSRTRPTSEKVRESVFNRISNWGVVDGAVVYDLFGGTGALAFEALSRGAERAVITEAHHGTAQVIRQNADALGVSDQCTIITARAAAIPAQIAAGHLPRPTLVFLDPPYTVNSREIATLLGHLAEAGLADEACVVIEQGTRTEDLELGEEFVDEGRREYGDTAVAFFTYLDPAITSENTDQNSGQNTETIG